MSSIKKTRKSKTKPVEFDEAPYKGKIGKGHGEGNSEDISDSDNPLSKPETKCDINKILTLDEIAKRTPNFNSDFSICQTCLKIKPLKDFYKKNYDVLMKMKSCYSCRCNYVKAKLKIDGELCDL